MKRFDQNDFWYEIVSEPDNTGRFVRYARVTCRVCKATARYHHGSLPDERVRKIFIRQNWELHSKSRFQHLCPECSKAAAPKKPKPDVTPKPTVAVSSPSFYLDDAWNYVDEVQRQEFCARHQEEIRRYLQIEPKPVYHPDWQHGPHIDSMPVEINDPIPAESQVIAMQENLPEPEFTDVPAPEEPDEPADWWKELNTHS